MTHEDFRRLYEAGDTTETTTTNEEEGDTMTITNTTTRINFETARETLQSASQRSAWARGVRDYALDLLDDLEDWTMAGDISPDQLTGDLDGILRNGAKDWKTYSWGGSALIYDGDICRRLCNNTEKKLTRNGERRPNSTEEWLDVQARALFQASQMVREAVRAATVTINTTETVAAVEGASEAATVA